jgi:hypothetical protein
MTGITRQLQRLTSASMYDQGRSRPIVVSLGPTRPTLIGLRLKGRRTTYYIDTAQAYRLAVRNHAEALKAERRKARQK